MSKKQKEMGGGRQCKIFANVHWGRRYVAQWLGDSRKSVGARVPHEAERERPFWKEVDKEVVCAAQWKPVLFQV